MRTDPLKSKFNIKKIELTAEAEKIEQPELRNKFARSDVKLP